jgi:mannose-6-phosphate isomerase-like protein (cupin superfamily)
MKPTKYSSIDTNKIDLGTKSIFKYPTPTKNMDIARMVVKGRHPQGKSKFILEHDCNFVIYIINGKGKICAGEEVFDVEVGDVVFVPKENKFAAEGDMEYITVDTPAFYMEQSEEIEDTKNTK